jgi:hypothetical protein
MVRARIERSPDPDGLNRLLEPTTSGHSTRQRPVSSVVDLMSLVVRRAKPSVRSATGPPSAKSPPR